MRTVGGTTLAVGFVEGFVEFSPVQMWSGRGRVLGQRRSSICWMAGTICSFPTFPSPPPVWLDRDVRNEEETVLMVYKAL